MMIIDIYLRYNLSHSAMKTILELVKTLAGPKFIDWNISNYVISKLYSSPDNKVHTYFIALNVI